MAERPLRMEPPLCLSYPPYTLCEALQAVFYVNECSRSLFRYLFSNCIKLSIFRTNLANSLEIFEVNTHRKRWASTWRMVTTATWPAVRPAPSVARWSRRWSSPTRRTCKLRKGLPRSFPINRPHRLSRKPMGSILSGVQKRAKDRRHASVLCPA